jgi:CRP/FNR family cyclic AMP-dependent transcriptional regulator
MPTDAALLGAVPFFQPLDEAERTALAALLEVVRIPARQDVFHYGDPGGSLYIIRGGEVEISFRSDTGEHVVLDHLGPGDFFGEISLLDGGSRSAAAVATRDLEALRLDRDDLEQFLQRHPSVALDLLTVVGRRLRQTDELLRHTAARNVNEEVEDLRTPVQRAADWIAEFTGSIPFLIIHAVWFGLWITANLVLGGRAFDPFPFGLLTMIVSLEAIFLSVFVLLSQNRQAAKDRVRGDIEYDVNLKAELEIAHLHEKVDEMRADLLARLAEIERGGHS